MECLWKTWHIDGVPYRQTNPCANMLHLDGMGFQILRHPEMAKEHHFFPSFEPHLSKQNQHFQAFRVCENLHAAFWKDCECFQRKRHGCKGLFQLWHWNTILVHHQTLAADRGCIAEARWKRAWGKHGTTDARSWCHQPSACLGLWLDVQLRSWSWGHIKHGFLQFCIDPECWFIRVMGTEEMHAVKSYTVPLFIEIVLWFLPRNCMNLLPWLKYTTTKAVKLFKVNFPFYFEPLQPLGLDPAVCCDARCANSLHLLRLEGELGYSDG